MTVVRYCFLPQVLQLTPPLTAGYVRLSSNMAKNVLMIEISIQFLQEEAVKDVP